MAVNRGKQFEEKVKNDWNKCFPVKTSLLVRLPDQVSHYRGTSSNISDFIGFAGRSLWLLEVKSIHGNTFPLVNLHQYDKLLAYKDFQYVYPGVVIWWIDLDKIAWFPINSIEKMKLDNKKSVNVKMLDANDYEYVIIPSIKKRVFMDSDYSILVNYAKKKESLYVK